MDTLGSGGGKGYLLAWCLKKSARSHADESFCALICLQIIVVPCKVRRLRKIFAEGHHAMWAGPLLPERRRGPRGTQET
ncbi:hypothetical protein BS47DRAFT_729771 [Hydnum rufescens UP504]|uniref:Uncharacterized protein n=1 Tax=Hydnum rufescens UP504 TaxID=1448309 RepID=A0A9P6B425_9AGAM|nr:hypothetical protein BS47DRAFT_729771 [Hydnum rufescens UP504]